MGEILSVLSGLGYAGSNVFNRRGVFYARESFSALPISMGVGILLFFVVTLATGSLARLSSLSWLGILSLSGAGIVHFVIGRAFNYTSLHLIGANRTSPLLATNTVFAVAFGLIFLDETLTLFRAVGIAAILCGIVLIGTSGRDVSKEVELEKGVLYRGIAAGLLAGLCYGTSPLLIKLGLREIGSPLAGGFVSYIAAGLVVLMLLNQKHRSQLGRLNRMALVPIMIGSVSVTLAQIFRYLALAFTPISIVTPLISTNNLFVPFLSFAVNRRLEVFSARVLGGSLAVIAGVFVIVLL